MRAPVFVYAAASLLSMVACSGAPPQTGAVPTPTPPAITVRSAGSGDRTVSLTLQRNGRRVYTVIADAIVSHRVAAGTGRSDFSNPQVTFFDSAGATLVARAPRASAFEANRSIVMRDGVHARSSKGIALQSRTLTYDDASAQLHGEGDVVMTTLQGERLEGSRLDADVRLNKVRVTGKRGT